MKLCVVKRWVHVGHPVGISPWSNFYPGSSNFVTRHWVKLRFRVGARIWVRYRGEGYKRVGVSHPGRISTIVTLNFYNGNPKPVP